MTSRRRVMVWLGVGLALVGGAVALVAWVGLDKANAYLGVPAAIAALLGLGLALYPLTDNEATNKGRPDPSSGQRAKATRGGYVVQVGGDSVSGNAANGGPKLRALSKSDAVNQHATAKGKGSRIAQIGGDRVDGGPDAGQA